MRSIPVSRSRIIARQRLLEMLQQHSGLRLINIAAPAGYGKTTFVATWAQSLAASSTDQRDPAWLTLFDDAEPEQLLRDILKALLPSLPTLQSILNLENSGRDSLTQRVRMLCAEIAATPRPVVLILDDYHLLTRPESHALIQQILNFAPDELLLVLSSRTMPPLQLNALILDDAVFTLTERDLAFDHADFTALVALLGLDSLPPTTLDDLEQRCAGWVTGLKLLAYDLRLTHAAASKTLSAHSSDGALRQFIESRVLASMPTHLQEFALAAASLPWMSADLMAAVTGDLPADCARILNELITANAFLSEFAGADGEPRFRFHPLVQDALRHAAAERPQLTDERRRAAVWLCDHDHVDEALAMLDDGQPPLRHALARAIRRALLRSEFTTAQRWLNALPPALLDVHAPFAVAAAWRAFLTEDFPQFKDAIPRAQTALAQHLNRAGAGNVELDGETAELQLDVAVLSIYLLILLGRPDDAVRALAAQAHVQPMDTIGYGYLHLMHALAPADPSDLETRVRMLQTAADLFERIGHDHGVVLMLYTQMFMKLRYADLRGALASATFLQGFCERRYIERHHYARENLTLRGWLLYLLDQVSEARPVLRKLVDTPVYDDQQEDIRYFGSLNLQLCDLAETSDPMVVLSSIDQVEDAARWSHTLENDFARAPGHHAWSRILRDYRTGHPERCRQTVESMHLTPADINEQTMDTARVAVLAGFVLGGQNSPQLAAQLDASAARFDSVHAAFMALQVRLLGVLHCLQHGDQREALSRLHALLPLVERSGAARLLLDFPVLRELLLQCNSPFAQQLLARFPKPRTDFGLTAQETRVLEHLASGRTTKEIAALHVVSHKTVYVQLYQIFKKLKVHSREEAVRVWQGSR